jgi:hypothetical protein
MMHNDVVGRNDDEKLEKFYNEDDALSHFL